MERSDKTLSTRDLVQPNEQAADDAGIADARAGGSEGAPAYDQERTAPDEAADGIRDREQTGIGTSADEADGSGATSPQGLDAATAGREDDDAVGATARRDQAGGSTTSGPGAVLGSTAVQDDSVPSQQTGTPAGGAGAAGLPATSPAGAASPGADTGAARAGAGSVEGAGDSPSLLSAEAGSSFQLRWEEVQTRFVDEPRGAVEAADGLVASLMQQIAEGFAQERERLEAQWDRGEDISTEDLRVALQRYRSFFQRLLSA